MRVHTCVFLGVGKDLIEEVTSSSRVHLPADPKQKKQKHCTGLGRLRWRWVQRCGSQAWFSLAAGPRPSYQLCPARPALPPGWSSASNTASLSSSSHL